MPGNGGLFEIYMNDLQIPTALARGFEDEAFAVVYGLTRIRQVPYEARQKWFEAQRIAARQTPDWVLALPNEGGGPRSPEYRWNMFMDRVGTLAMAAYSGGIDDKSLQTPNLRLPWSLWPFEFNNVAPRVLGEEGGIAATNQHYITPAQILKAPGTAVDAAKARASSFLQIVSPGGALALKNAGDAIDNWGVTTYLKTFVPILFWAGVKKMAPGLVPGLTEIAGYLASFQKALTLWPAVVSAMIAAGAWDLETLQANQTAVAAYQRDQKRRDAERNTSISSAVPDAG